MKSLNRSQRFCLPFLLSLILFPVTVVASNQGPQATPGDPYQATPYQEIFHMQNLRKIWEEFPGVLRAEGLEELLERYPLEAEPPPSWFSRFASGLVAACKRRGSYLPLSMEDPDFPAQSSEALNARLVADFIQKNMQRPWLLLRNGVVL